MPDISGNVTEPNDLSLRENNRANIDVMKQIARKYSVNSSNVRIVSGSRSRKKIIDVKK